MTMVPKWFDADMKIRLKPRWKKSGRLHSARPPETVAAALRCDGSPARFDAAIERHPRADISSRRRARRDHAGGRNGKRWPRRFECRVVVIPRAGHMSTAGTTRCRERGDRENFCSIAGHSCRKPLVILNVVGLTHEMLGPNTPHLSRFAADGFSGRWGRCCRPVKCSALSTILTGTLPGEHGISRQRVVLSRSVGSLALAHYRNGWFHGDGFTTRRKIAGCELHHGEYVLVVQHVRQREYSMDAAAELSRRRRKVMDSYSQPAGLRDELQARLGVFRCSVWGRGPTSRVRGGSRMTSVEVLQRFRPTLLLVYLPHLDYNLQRLGPDDPQIANDVRLIDAEAGKVITAAQGDGYDVIALSDYAITPVSRGRCISIGTVCCSATRLSDRHRGNHSVGETLDGRSLAGVCGLADHQIAHVYVQRPVDLKDVPV